MYCINVAEKSNISNVIVYLFIYYLTIYILYNIFYLMFPNDPLVMWFFGVDDVAINTPFSLTEVVDKHDVDPLIFLNGESTSSGVSPKIEIIH